LRMTAIITELSIDIYPRYDNFKALLSFLLKTSL